MKIEYEARVFIDDVSSLINRFNMLSYEFKYASFQKRYVYDLIPAVKGKWIRLRSDGNTITLTYKEILDKEIAGAQEIEIAVSDFDTTNELLSKMGFSPRSYQENFRIHYTAKGSSFDIDFWPGIQPYLEIESKDSCTVEESFRELGFNASQLITSNVDRIFLDYYSIDLDTMSELRFTKKEHDFLFTLKRRLENVR